MVTGGNKSPPEFFILYMRRPKAVRFLQGERPKPEFCTESVPSLSEDEKPRLGISTPSSRQPSLPQGRVVRATLDQQGEAGLVPLEGDGVSMLPEMPTTEQREGRCSFSWNRARAAYKNSFLTSASMGKLNPSAR
jgi:hypothetical protein